MKLYDLIKDIEIVPLNAKMDCDITGITMDSRQVKAGYLFVAREGELFDGHQYIESAIERGAAAVLVTKSNNLPNVPALKYEFSTELLAQLADRFFGQPACKLIGITGTNGKTTTSYLVRYILEDNNIRTGLISTIAVEFDGRSIPAKRTTPDVFELYTLIAQMVKNGAQAVVMEVSSHALVQNRIGKIKFDNVVFTNLTQDHLDYHLTMQAYFDAKALLFEENLDTSKQKTICIDDEWGQKLAQKYSEATTLSIMGNPASLSIGNIEINNKGSKFTINNEDLVELRLIGRHNIANAICAYAVALQLGCKKADLINSLKTAPAVPGRLEFLENTLGLLIVIDYAHTDAALYSTLKSLHEINQGEIYVVFGCGGDRDRKKRAKMGAVAEELAEHVVLTDDNPRTEPSMQIIDEIRTGMHKNMEIVESDRRKAIATAIASAKAGDVVLIAGKGHESYQEVNHVFMDYNERIVTRQIIKEMEQSCG